MGENKRKRDEEKKIAAATGNPGRFVCEKKTCNGAYPSNIKIFFFFYSQTNLGYVFNI